MALLGYARVSTTKQELDRQILQIGKVDKLFAEKISGKDTERPELQKLLNYVRAGDTVIITSIDRLARNALDLILMVNDLAGRGVTVKFLNEGLEYDPYNPSTKLTLTVYAGVAEFECSISSARRREARRVRQLAGKPVGKPKALNKQQVYEVREKHKQGVSKKRLAKDYKVARATISKALEHGYLLEEQNYGNEEQNNDTKKNLPM